MTKDYVLFNSLNNNIFWNILHNKQQNYERVRFQTHEQGRGKYRIIILINGHAPIEKKNCEKGFTRKSQQNTQ